MSASKLFEPISLANVTLPNRIVIAPMCQYSADNGSATDWHTIHLGQLGMSGAGLLIIEATAVEPDGRITPDDLGLWDDTTEQALANTLKAVRAHATMPIGIQLSHAGRKASTDAPWNGGKQLSTDNRGWQTVAPSAIAMQDTDRAPTALSESDLERIKASFVATALRAVKLELSLIELHAAHGYLLHQFLSPLANQRTDTYGGSLENRMRFPLEVFDAVKQAVPKDYPVGVRLSATDWVEGGWDVEQSVAFAQALDVRGCDYIHISSGGVSTKQQIPVAPGYQIPAARRINEAVNMPVMSVGMITEPDHAEAIVANGDADMVALARGILFDPHWPWKAAAQLGAQVLAPKQYLRSQPRRYKDLLKVAP